MALTGSHTEGSTGHVTDHNLIDAALLSLTNSPVVLTSRTGGAAVLVDQAGDDAQHFGTTWTGKRWDLRMGTSSVPRAGGGPGFKISQTEYITNLATQMGSNPADSAANSALSVNVVGQAGSLAQATAIHAAAKGAPTGTDVCALTAWGRVTGGTGIGYGAYIEGRRDLSAARAAGMEVRVQNEGTADGVTSVSGISDTSGIWLTTSSTGGYKSATGMALGAVTPYTAGFKIGYHVTEGGVFNHSFRDEAGSQVSFMSRGAHTSGVDMGSATFTGNAILLPASTTAATGAIIWGSDFSIWRSGANTGQITATSGLTIDGGVTLTDAKNLAFGTTTGTRIGTATTQKIGFFNATPVVRPTGWAAATGTATRSTFVTGSVTLPQLAERVKALTDDLIALGLIGA